MEIIVQKSAKYEPAYCQSKKREISGLKIVRKAKEAIVCRRQKPVLFLRDVRTFGSNEYRTECRVARGPVHIGGGRSLNPVYHLIFPVGKTVTDGEKDLKLEDGQQIEMRNQKIKSRQWDENSLFLWII